MVRGLLRANRLMRQVSVMTMTRRMRKRVTQRRTEKKKRITAIMRKVS